MEPINAVYPINAVHGRAGRVVVVVLNGAVGLGVDSIAIKCCGVGVRSQAFVFKSEMQIEFWPIDQRWRICRDKCMFRYDLSLTRTILEMALKSD